MKFSKEMSTKIKSLLLTLLLTLSLASWAWGTTYYMRADGTATNKATATGPETNVAVCMDVAVHNSETFAAEDVIVVSDDGGIYRVQLTPPSSGSGVLTQITYVGSGEPEFRASTLYDSWWQLSSISNGSFEYCSTDTSPPDNDVFEGWGVAKVDSDSGGDNYVQQAITPDGLAGTYCVAMLNDGTGGWGTDNYCSVSRNYTFVAETTYYWDMLGRVTANGTYMLIAQIRFKVNGTWNYVVANGTIATAGTTTTGNWSAETPNTWVRKSVSFTVPTGTITEGKIVVYNFNTGTAYIDDCYLNVGTARSTTKVWAGNLSGLATSYGMVDAEGRITKDTVVTTPLTDVADDQWYSASGYFYYRRDSGDPGGIEVGDRNQACYVNGKDYITFSGIDFGYPTGDTELGAFYSNGSTYITLDSANLYYGNKSGAKFYNGSHNTVQNCEQEHCGNGIWFLEESDFLIDNNTVSSSRLVTSDSADGCGICLTTCGAGTVSSNNVTGNALNTATADFEISAVGSTGAISILRNSIEDASQGGIQIAEGGDGSVIALNKVSGFGTTSYDGATSSGIFSGIRIGGGAAPAPVDVFILNNVLVNGGMTGPRTAGLTVPDLDANTTTGLVVKNNIFAFNSCPDVIIYEDGDATHPVTTGFVFSNNCYHKTDYTNNWYDNATGYSTLATWQAAIDFTGKDIASLAVDPKFWNATTYDFRAKNPNVGIGGTNVNLTTDYNGDAIPFAGGYPIGVYRYHGGVPWKLKLLELIR